MILGRRSYLKMDEVPGAGGGAPIVTPTPGSVPPDTSWHTGFAEDVKSYATTKGWKDPASVVDSYRNLEKLVGVKEKLLQVPDDFGDEKAMGPVYDRLGRPKEAKEYGFKAADEKLDTWAKETFHKLGLSANQGKALMDSYDALSKSQATENEGKFAAENEQKINALKTEWGSAYEQNVNVAKAAAKQFGVTSEIVSKLEQVMGYADTMKFLQNVGSKIGEASFHSGNPNNENAILTPSQANSKIAELSKDKSFFTKLTSGDVQAKNQWEKLNKMAVGTYQP